MWCRNIVYIIVSDLRIYFNLNRGDCGKTNQDCFPEFNSFIFKFECSVSYNESTRQLHLSLFGKREKLEFFLLREY